MTTPNLTQPHTTAPQTQDRGGALRRLTTETKQAFKTTEFWAMVVVIVGILVSAAAIHGGDNGTDEFTARHAWLYVAVVAAGYMISRGLAKSGSRDPYTDDTRHDQNGRGH
ncbi:MAG: hypothetical protein QOJ07_3478 [Thermoleophilaceae bacterium]|jgi:uncharacterized membrane protein YcjF (UPF0283 family)|nr:hypothetical protein [Thermoleophilaceae bacterium]